MRALRSSPVRVLDDRDVPETLELLRRDPLANVFVTARVQAAGLRAGRLGAEIWGYSDDGRLSALCYSGANLVPVGADGAAVQAFAERARRQGRRCSSIVGPAEMVEPLWHLLHPHWGAARDVRERQPFMAVSRPSPLPPDPGVRRVRPDELDVLMPACIAMFTEEIGVSPLSGGGAPLYRARVAEIVASGHAFARIEDGRVVFKAEVGAATSDACQVQGVWVDPQLRGRGYATSGMAAVVNEALRTVAPTVTLYVNDFNEAAICAYRHVGFARVGTFMSVLF